MENRERKLTREQWKRYDDLHHELDYVSSLLSGAIGEASFMLYWRAKQSAGPYTSTSFCLTNEEAKALLCKRLSVIKSQLRIEFGEGE